VVNFTPLLLYPWGRVPGSNWIGGWVSPRARLEFLEERKFLILPYSNSYPLVVELVPSLYIDCAIPVLSTFIKKIEILQ
jgi:hypothetical protein